ncbi:MAG: hypothetical protein M1535_02565 [Candidatus Thermoplasmatota archaeon]|nr:hypothetical protein [Candidatus Thermoplasmatota archaeon]
MPQVKLKGRMETIFKLRTVFVIVFLISFFLTLAPTLPFFNNVIFSLSQFNYITANIITFYSNPNLLNFYGTIMGLLMAAYTVLISMIPVFHPDSLKQPIFGQINRLFVFTIFIGLFSMVFVFVSSVLSHNSLLAHYIIFVEVFLFLSLIIGLMFSVFALSDMFKILSGRKESRILEEEKKQRTRNMKSRE